MRSPELCYCLRNISPFSNYFLKHLRMHEFFFNLNALSFETRAVCKSSCLFLRKSRGRAEIQLRYAAVTGDI